MNHPTKLRLSKLTSLVFQINSESYLMMIWFFKKTILAIVASAKIFQKKLKLKLLPSAEVYARASIPLAVQYFSLSECTY